MRLASRSLAWIIAGLVLILGSCAPFGKGTTQRTQYFMLNSIYAKNTDTRPPADLNTVAIGVGPIRFPRHLDRMEIVSRTSDNEVVMGEFALWAGPLSENFTRVLAENLSLLLGTDQVEIFPYRTQFPFKYQVIVHVTRFDGQPGKAAWLRARWFILSEKGKEILIKHQTIVEEPTGGSGMAALVAAESRTLEKLSREIAQVIAGLEQ